MNNVTGTPSPREVVEPLDIMRFEEERRLIMDRYREAGKLQRFQNVYINGQTMQYILVTDEAEAKSELHLGYWEALGYVLLCDTQRGEELAHQYMRWFYPEYLPLKLQMVPVHFRDAKTFIDKTHRHHISPVGHKYSLAVSDGSQVIGVLTVGRPVAKAIQDGETLEVTRVSVFPGFQNVCSMLLGRAKRIASNMGYRRLVSYTLVEEDGASYKASGFCQKGITKGGSWNTAGRPRVDKHPTGPKRVWECVL